MRADRVSIADAPEQLSVTRLRPPHVVSEDDALLAVSVVPDVDDRAPGSRIYLGVADLVGWDQTRKPCEQVGWERQRVIEGMQLGREIEQRRSVRCRQVRHEPRIRKIPY
jgi:hypothetical protein